MGQLLPAAGAQGDIPKGDGKTRPLGIPTVADRIAQMVVKRYLEPTLEPIFHADSYGYRPGRSAHQALRTVRRRCWRYNWVLDLDIKGFFDNIDWNLLMRALRRHTDCKWVLLYIERWLKAPVQMQDGALVSRTKGSPQGAVISPLLANLFLHYAFDRWMSDKHLAIPFERYADDIICHCRSEEQARTLHRLLIARLAACCLELHPEKTKIVYCKDANRRGNYPTRQFDFLGFIFRPHNSMNRYGKLFTSFSPAVSDKAGKAMRKTIRRWRLHFHNDLDLEEIARWVRPKLVGWIRYYGLFHRSALRRALRTIDAFIVRWAQRKYKRYRRRTMRTWEWLRKLQSQRPPLFAHWLTEVEG